MFKAVLFDLDGTLLDTRKGVKSAVEMTIEQLQLEWLDKEELEQFVGPPMQESFARRYQMSEDDALKAANLFRENYKLHTLLEAQLYEGVIELMDKLKRSGCKIAVATNKSHDNAVAILKHYGVAERSDYILGSDLQGKMKKADIIEECIVQLQVEKEQAVYVGDSSYDSDGAAHVGISFIGVTYGFGFHSKEEAAKVRNIYVCDSVKELEHFLLN